MPTLHQQIAALANAFTHEVLGAFRGLSMAELSELGATRGRSGRVAKRSTPSKTAPATGERGKGARRLARRSPEQIAAAVGKIVAVLRGKKAGLRAEQIQKAIGLTRKEMPRPIREALAKKVIRRKGHKRATTYFAA